MKKIAILGASGSIGKQTIDIINEFPNQFKLIAATVNHSVNDLDELINNHDLDLVAAHKDYKDTLLKKHSSLRFFDTQHLDDFIEALPNDTILLNALVGSVGLSPTVKAIKKGLDILLANKETLVVGGEIINPLLKTSPSKLIPIDSEHSALALCMQGHLKETIDKIVITASGGSFRDYSKEALKDVKVNDALKHPNWDMGAKITIDSATMMNKVFEVIEAHYLFDVSYDQIDAIIHKESIIHGMVYYKDGNVMAHMGPSDMHIPILTALQGSNHLSYPTVFDITKIGSLHFEPIDRAKYPLFDLGLAVAKRKGSHVVTMNAANEVAVELFLKEKISYLEIETVIVECLNYFDNVFDLTLEFIIAHDQEVRAYIRSKYLDGD
ncbi:MAG: 1-deoxy-D-xylulose-5-phosphate reductoisomerase [Candidatus Izemoplasmataceae bacterium]